MLFATYVWLQWSPDVEPLIAQIPEWPNPIPTNDSPDLLLSLQPPSAERGSSICSQLYKTPDAVQMREYALSHPDEVVRLAETVQTHFDTLDRLCTYSDVFDPPRRCISVAEPTVTMVTMTQGSDGDRSITHHYSDGSTQSWTGGTSPPTERTLGINLAPLIILQMLTSEAALASGDRGELQRLIGYYGMIHRWRKNQWSPVSAIVGLACTANLNTYFQQKLDHGDLTPAEIQQIAAVLAQARPISDLSKVFPLQELHSTTTRLIAVRKGLLEVRCGWWGRRLFNTDATLKVLLTQHLGVIAKLEADDWPGVERMVDDWPTRHKPEWYTLYNRYGSLWLWANSSHIGYGFSSLDEEERRLLRCMEMPQ